MTLLQELLEIKDQQGSPVFVCLCGSTRFGEEFHKHNLKETMAGKIVLSIGINTKSDADLLLAGEMTQEDKKGLDVLHLWKIWYADEVLILNVGGYVGDSTKREVEYAMALERTIRWLEPDKAWNPKEDAEYICNFLK